MTKRPQRAGGPIVYRALTIAVAAASLVQVGCTSMWDAVTSRRFREAPFKTVGKVISPEDPVVVLRADPPRTGDERAKAMNRLKEPIRNKGTQEDQDQMIGILEQAATADPSPVLRYAAINALGRFEDERVPRILMVAYQKADGQPEGAVAPPPAPKHESAIVPVGGLSAGRAPTKSGLDVPTYTGIAVPTGYAQDTVAALRCRCLESLGHTNSPEAAHFLSAVAGASGPDIKPTGTDDPEVRQAAVRALGQCRQPDAVVALAAVLSNETGKDYILTRGAHQGLVRLTGKKLPPDPQQWGEVVQAGVVIAPEPTWAENVIQNVAFWEKK